jgi:GDP-L-fucose synthase
MILVTGSGGPLGSALKNQLGNLGLYPRSFECDLTDQGSISDWADDKLHHKKIDGVIHLAAKSGGAHLSDTQPADIFRENMLMAINVLELARKLNIPRVIMTLSTACYSEGIDNPSESNLHAEPALGRDYSYAYAKRMMEPLMRAYNQQYSMGVSCVLVNGIIGPNMNYREKESILPAALIRRFYDAKVQGRNDLTVWGDGSPVREYSDSSDLARAIMWCFENQSKDSLLNIGSTEKITVRQCAESIARALGINPKNLDFDISKNGGRKIQSTDNSKFRALSNFEYTPFDLSIVKTVNWYVNQKKCGRSLKI